jgi:hypothetical protein
MLPYSKKANKYFAKHPWENSTAHTLLGIGVGFLLTYPLAQAHPVRWALVFIILAGLMHLKAAR